MKGEWLTQRSGRRLRGQDTGQSLRRLNPSRRAKEARKEDARRSLETELSKTLRLAKGRPAWSQPKAREGQVTDFIALLDLSSAIGQLDQTFGPAETAHQT